MTLANLSAAVLLSLPLAAWGQSSGPAVDSLLAQAGADALPAAPAAPGAVQKAPTSPAARANFCTTNLYTYQDQPVSGYDLTCTNASLGLVLHHSTGYDQSALFAPDGRCSPKHRASVMLRSDATKPFEFDHASFASGETAGRRELELYRDGAGVEPGEFLLNLTWIQGGDVYQLGYIPETRGTPSRVFKLASGSAASGSFTLKAAAVPFSFASDKTVDGRAISYQTVPVDCEMTISVDSWYGR